MAEIKIDTGSWVPAKLEITREMEEETQKQWVAMVRADEKFRKMTRIAPQKRNIILEE